jgi:hypothetical protein
MNVNNFKGPLLSEEVLFFSFTLKFSYENHSFFIDNCQCISGNLPGKAGFSPNVDKPE